MAETHRAGRGGNFPLLYTALESGAVNLEAKAVVVPTEAELTRCLEGATDTNFVVVVQSRDVDRLRLLLLYARPRQRAVRFTAGGATRSWLPCCRW